MLLYLYLRTLAMGRDWVAALGLGSVWVWALGLP